MIASVMPDQYSSPLMMSPALSGITITCGANSTLPRDHLVMNGDGKYVERVDYC